MVTRCDQEWGCPPAPGGSPSASTSLIMSCSSASVGFWPRDLITVPNSLVVMVPSPSLSKREKASLNSGVREGTNQRSRTTGKALCERKPRAAYRKEPEQDCQSGPLTSVLRADPFLQSTFIKHLHCVKESYLSGQPSPVRTEGNRLTAVLREFYISCWPLASASPSNDEMD